MICFLYQLNKEVKFETVIEWCNTEVTVGLHMK